MNTPKRKRNIFIKILKWFTLAGVLTIGCLTVSVYVVYRTVEPELPDTQILKDVKYQVPLKVYARDGRLIAQFGEKRRSPIKYAQAPELLIQAILAAEDERFFVHPGVDYQGLARAAVKLLLTGERRQGGSTITMQVARNFFLNREKTFSRKFKEIFLAFRIEQKLTKREILELYLNKIYLGHRAYGVAAAAQIYYGKSVDELSLAEIATIAGLPKAPSKYNPLTDPERALERRYYVLRRMHTRGYISDQEFERTVRAPDTATLHTLPQELHAPYMAEMVRERMVDYLGEKAYTGGYRVYTTLDSRLQLAAQQAFFRALHAYDERHGYRGPEGHAGGADWKTILDGMETIGDTEPAIVTTVSDKSVAAHLKDGNMVGLEWTALKWARKYFDEDRLGPWPTKASEILSVGDVIRLRRDADTQEWRLAQIPQVEGALVSLDPNNGAINALVGGFDFNRSNFNRAIQAKRQTGSGFKPILYTAALENGYTPASIINDAPIVLGNASTGEEWRPANFTGRFYGPTRLRVALRRSQNLVSVRLIQRLGVGKVVGTAMRLGLPKSQLPRIPSLSLGSGSASPLEMARVYAVFANGGFRVEPFFIDRIESVEGEILYRSYPQVACNRDCRVAPENPGDLAPRVISPQVHFLIYSMLQDVVRRGTAARANQLGRGDIAGKTGTTNEQRDAWFNGFSPDLVATAWVGFDSSRPLGDRETGSRAALPMWMHYMQKALADIPERRLEQPDGILSMRIDPATGLLASPNDPGAIFEYFAVDSAPSRVAQPDYAPSNRLGAVPEQHIQSLF